MISRALLVLALVVAAPAFAESPAARVGDLTDHGGVITAPGAPTVLIGGRPAARVGDLATDPLVIGLVPCVGGPILTGSTTVLIGGRPAARVGDQVSNSCGPLAVIILGSPTVLIGN
jgi:uncharacterized Zn-binding protein involved in type VI secretion